MEPTSLPGSTKSLSPIELRRRPPRLAELATWTSDWREAWGRRANEIEDEGVPWPEHEIRAFDEIKALRAKAKGDRAPLAKDKPPSKRADAKPTKVETTGKLNLGGTKP